MATGGSWNNSSVVSVQPCPTVPSASVPPQVPPRSPTLLPRRYDIASLSYLMPFPSSPSFVLGLALTSPIRTIGSLFTSASASKLATASAALNKMLNSGWASPLFHHEQTRSDVGRGASLRLSVCPTAIQHPAHSCHCEHRGACPPSHKVGNRGARPECNKCNHNTSGTVQQVRDAGTKNKTLSMDT